MGAWGSEAALCLPQPSPSPSPSPYTPISLTSPTPPHELLPDRHTRRVGPLETVAFLGGAEGPRASEGKLRA